MLFLGIKDAVYIFTKILVPHKTYFRSMGIRNSIYIDDQSVLGSSLLECAGNTQITPLSFEKARKVVIRLHKKWSFWVLKLILCK